MPGAIEVVYQGPGADEESERLVGWLVGVGAQLEFACELSPRFVKIKISMTFGTLASLGSPLIPVMLTIPRVPG